jgi:hypothetical protein
MLDKRRSRLTTCQHSTRTELTAQVYGTTPSVKPSSPSHSASRRSTRPRPCCSVNPQNHPKPILHFTNHFKDNDYNIEDNGNKTAGAVRIVKLIKSYGVHIDGVGYQGHLTSEATNSNPGAAPNQATLTAALRATADLGVKVAYTELDVRLNTTTTSPEKVAQQVAVWENVARACLSVEACIGMTVWGVSDKYSWIPGVFPGEGSGLLFDDDYNKKPSYYGFLRGIEGPKKP